MSNRGQITITTSGTSAVPIPRNANGTSATKGRVVIWSSFPNSRTESETDRGEAYAVISRVKGLADSVSC